MNQTKNVYLAFNSYKLDFVTDNTVPFSDWLILDELDNFSKIISACLHYGIPIGKFKYNTISDISYFKKFSDNNQTHSYSNSKYIQKRSLFLPIYENLSYKNIKNIAKGFKKIIMRYKTNPDDVLFDTHILGS